MPATLDFFDTYYLAAIFEEYVSRTFFFKDRYFRNNVVFASDKVLTEYRQGDRRMAAFVAERVGDIPMGRRGYEVRELQPAYIGVSRFLTLDDLKKRGFGEALYTISTPKQRAARLIRDDLGDMDLRIRRREEWMAVQTMLNNACTMQTYIDDKTKGEKLEVYFYNKDNGSDHLYTVSAPWSTFAEMRADVIAMCRQLSYRGLPVSDLLLGTDVADKTLQFEDMQRLLDKNSGIAVGSIREQLTGYTGVVLLGTLNFGGFMLNVFSVDESYQDDDGTTKPYFPPDGAMVTAPDCGQFMYGQITQVDYGSDILTTHPGIRVPKFTIDQDKDLRKLRLASRPLAVFKNYCPCIVARGVAA